MKEYYELKQKMDCIVNEYEKQLNELLEQNEYNSTMGWLKFGEDGLLVVWDYKKISSEMLNELQKTFGRIEKIECNNIGTGLIIQFYKEK